MGISVIMCHDVVDDHMVEHMCTLHDCIMIIILKHEGMLFQRKGVCDTYEIQGNFSCFELFQLIR